MAVTKKYHGWKWNPSTSSLEIYIGTTKVASFSATAVSIVPATTVTGTLATGGATWTPSGGIAYQAATKTAITPGAAVTLSAAQVLSGYIDAAPSEADAMTLPLATDLIAALTALNGAAAVGTNFDLYIINNAGGAYTITVTTNTGNTLINAAATIAQNKSALYRVYVTGVAAVTYTRIDHTA